jgi:hypothetical protein
MPVQKGKFFDHNKGCTGRTKTCDGSAASAVKPNVCRDCEQPLTGPYSEHKPKCSFQIEKAKETSSQKPKDGNEKSCDNAPSKGPEKSDPVTPSGGKVKASKGSEKSDAVAPSGGGGKSSKDAEKPSHAIPVGGGGGNNSKAPKGPKNSSSAASVGGGGPEKTAPGVDLTLIPRAVAQDIYGFTFVNISGIAVKANGVCAHMVQGPGFSCTADGCTGKLLKGGCCFTTATGKLFAVVQPKTADNNRAYWRKPTKDEISLLKMPVAVAVATTDV